MRGLGRYVVALPVKKMGDRSKYHWHHCEHCCFAGYVSMSLAIEGSTVSPISCCPWSMFSGLSLAARYWPAIRHATRTIRFITRQGAEVMRAHRETERD